MKPKDYEIRCAAAEAGIVAWVDVEGDSVLADATVRMVEILTSKGILTLTSPQASAAVPACEWSPDGDDQEMPDTWDGSCGARWTFTEGGPAENTMNFCPQCGGRVHVAASQPEVKS